MTLDAFIKINTGKPLDFDGYYRNQCVDLYRFYLQDVWGVPQTPSVKGAAQIFNSLPPNFDKFTSGIPQAGDIITWNEQQVIDGHVAVVESANAMNFMAFQQNAPKTGDPCNSARYTYKNVIGWFRPKLNTTYMTVTVIANNNTWPTLADQCNQLRDYFSTYSGGRLIPVINIAQSSFSSIPITPFLGGDGASSIDPSWYRDNITPLSTGQISLFTVNPDDYHNGNTWGFMTYGDPGKPVRCEISSAENVPNTDGTPLFVMQGFHEICHALFFLTGQPDRVHEFVYPLPGNPKGLLDLIDYQKLQQALSNINPEPMNQTKIVLSKDGKTVYKAVPIAEDFESFKKQAGVEGIIIPSPIPPASSL